LNPYASIGELAKGIKARKFSSVELTEMYLKRLETLGREYNAVAEVTREHALAQARKADETVPRNALHGIPFGAKDLLATKGIPTRWGSPGHDDQVFDYDATSIRKLYDRGAVLIGKLAMIELAGGGNYNVPAASATGACLCAWDKDRWAGGSSSGSGAATALGCVAYSLGSETSGSITCPSAFNGLTGFRPTYGRVSRYGAMALCWTLDKIGPMCRSAEDCRVVMEAIAGHDENDPSSLRDRLNLGRKSGKPVIGLLKEDFVGNKATACEKGYQEVLAIFRKLGYETVEVAYPKMPYDAAVQIIVDCEGASAHEHFIRGDRFQKLADIHQVAGFTSAMETRAVDYLWALRLRTEALKANEIWTKCDALFTPVFYHAAPASDQSFDKTWVNMGGDGGPSNLLGWPSMAFPIAWEDGAPIGGQIMAPCLREDRCYQIVAAIQRESDWHLRRATAGKQ
jgi:aspartyl-tRNA(Asn)/glutamyl-tRNA(Gln) amidotransferase subunit A